MKTPALAASLSLFLSTQTLPAQNQQTAQGAKGSIEGSVGRVGTGEPIPGARVTLTKVTVSTQPLPAVPTPPPSGPPATSTATTDSQGRFVVKDVDPGSYRLTAAANGYARQEYGQRGFTGLGTPVRVDADQVAKNIAIRLTQAGNVSGRITDGAGSPAVGVPVQLLRATYTPTGERTFQSSGGGRTNDRGEYRLFWITPGRYIFTAGTTASIAPIEMTGGSPNEVPENRSLVFYPAASDPSQASVIEVQPGAEVANIDVVAPARKLYRVRGRLLDAATSRPPTVASVQFGYRTLSGGSSSRAAQYDATDGTFEVRDVAPGRYFIVATPTPPGPPSATASGIPRIQKDVTVADSDLEGLELTIAPGVPIPGRVIVEDQAVSTLPGLDSMRVQLSLVGFLPFQRPIQARLNADGTFREDDMTPGDYRVSVTSLPPNFYVKEGRFDQADVIGQPLHFSGSVPGPLDLVLSSKAGQIDGTVANDKREPIAGIQTVLIPDQRDRIDLYKTAVTDQNGRFTIRGIAPGAYKVFAWEALDRFAYFDPDLVREYEPAGKAVRIVESSKESIDVRLIPERAQ